MVDVNGVRHHLLLGERDWSRAIVGEVAPDDEHDARVRATSDDDISTDVKYDRAAQVARLRALTFVFPQPVGDRILGPEDRRGAACDRYGHWFWIDRDERTIRVRWAGAQKGDHYWSAGDPQACDEHEGGTFGPVAPPAPRPAERLSGLAVTSEQYLVVGAPERGSLLVFDLLTGGQPVRVPLPPPPGPTGQQTDPFDLASLPDGGLLVLDRRHRLVWRLDATFRAAGAPAPDPGQPLLFQPVGGPARQQPTAGRPVPIALDGVADPISVEPLPDGSLLILDRARPGVATVWRFDRRGGTRVDLPLPRADLFGHDLAFVASGGDSDRPGTVFLVDTAGNQALAYDLDLTDDFALIEQHRYFPLRSHTGKALVAPPGSAYAHFDRGERWPQVVALDRPRYVGSASLELAPLDGREPGCVWHRLCLDACLPPGTGVEIESRAADAPGLLESRPWQREPALYHRDGGAEIPYYRLWTREELGHEATGTWELLFQQARGRYLQLRLTLRGDGRTTPKIRALRAHYPRFSYLRQYLPAAFQDDSASAALLDAFLANPEGLLTTLEGKLADARAIWDARTVPPDALEWLAGWIGLALDPGWSETQRRLMLKHAPALYLRRGTLTGLSWALRLALDPEAGPAILAREYDDRASTIRIVERFKTRRFAGAAVGDPTDQADPSGDALTIARDRAHRFIVLLPSALGPDARALVERIVEAQKPAHTLVVLKRYWDVFRVGEARLGLDTRLGPDGRFVPFLLGETALAEGAIGAAYPEDHDLAGRRLLAP
jgi:phage tail-like protein